LFFEIISNIYHGGVMKSKNKTSMSRSEAGKLVFQKAKATIEKMTREREEAYNKNPKRCIFCNKALPYNKRRNTLCNHSCRASHLNLTRNIKNARKEVACLSCGKPTKNPKYCCRRCQWDHEWEQTRRKIKLQGNVKLNLISNRKPAKRYLKEERGIQCEVCGLRKWQGQEVPLVLDHIDGNSDNWDLTNLRLICGNCDMQTPFYCGKNYGNGRHYRRQRYKEGKSY